MPETITTCPFCKKMTITILHVPFVTNTFTSKCRAGGKTTIIQKERYDVLSGCDVCGKLKKDVEEALNRASTKELSHEDRLKRMKDAGLPTRFEG